MIHALLYHRKKTILLLLLSAGVLLVNIPWIIFVSDVDYTARYGILNYTLFIASIKVYMSYFLKDCIGINSLCIVGIVCSFYGMKKIFYSHDKPTGDINVSNLFLLIIYAGVNLLFLSLFNPAPFFRYLAPVIPVCCLIITPVVNSAINIHAGTSIGIIAIMIYFSSFTDYLYEITHDYDGPIEGIVNYINQHGGKDDIVAVTYGDLPIKLYTNMRVVGGLTGEDLSPAQHANWIILRSYVISWKDLNVRKYLMQNIPWDKYQELRLNYPELPFENREEPSKHRFRTVTTSKKVRIFKKIKE